MRSSSLTVQIAMARAGVGIALLPDFAVGPQDGLDAVLPGEVRVHRSYWISAATEMRTVPRIRHVWDAIIAGARAGHRRA